MTTTSKRTKLAPFGGPQLISRHVVRDAKALVQLGVPHRWTHNGREVGMLEIGHLHQKHTDAKTDPKYLPKLRLEVSSKIHRPGTTVFAKRGSTISNGEGSTFSSGERFRVRSIYWEHSARAGKILYTLERPGNREDRLDGPLPMSFFYTATHDQLTSNDPNAGARKRAEEKAKKIATANSTRLRKAAKSFGFEVDRNRRAASIVLEAKPGERFASDELTTLYCGGRDMAEATVDALNRLGVGTEKPLREIAREDVIEPHEGDD